jgi:uncharacterized protein YaeQ
MHEGQVTSVLGAAAVQEGAPGRHKKMKKWVTVGQPKHKKVTRAKLASPHFALTCAP